MICSLLFFLYLPADGYYAYFILPSSFRLHNLSFYSFAEDSPAIGIMHHPEHISTTTGESSSSSSSSSSSPSSSYQLVDVRPIHSSRAVHHRITTKTGKELREVDQIQLIFYAKMLITVKMAVSHLKED